MNLPILTRLALTLTGLLFTAAGALASPPRPILIGLDADLSSGSARAGESIRRGAQIAIGEINAGGGVLGRPLELVARDHRGNPARGKDNIDEFAAMPDLVAVLAGLHTPVALHELDAVHEHGLVFLVPWAAGTSVVDNGRQPNYVFRVSVRDQDAGAFLVEKALQRGFRRPGLLLEQTGWGRSNEKAMTAALAARGRGLTPVGTQWFLWGARDLTGQIEQLRASGADVLLFVGNAPEGGALVRSLVGMEQPPLPVISHWGITGGNFFADNHEAIAQVDLSFLQTHSFLIADMSQQSRELADNYLATFADAERYEQIFAPAGTAHAHDLVHLLALAIETAGTTERARVRDAMEALPPYHGAARLYAPAFTAERHDALDASDFRLARFDAKGAIVPEPAHD